MSGPVPPAERQPGSPGAPWPSASCRRVNPPADCRFPVELWAIAWRRWAGLNQNQRGNAPPISELPSAHLSEAGLGTEVDVVASFSIDAQALGAAKRIPGSRKREGPNFDYQMSELRRVNLPSFAQTAGLRPTGVKPPSQAGPLTPDIPGGLACSERVLAGWPSFTPAVDLFSGARVLSRLFRLRPSCGGNPLQQSLTALCPCHS